MSKCDLKDWMISQSEHSWFQSLDTSEWANVISKTRYIRVSKDDFKAWIYQSGQTGFQSLDISERAWFQSIDTVHKNQQSWFQSLDISEWASLTSKTGYLRVSKVDFKTEYLSKCDLKKPGFLRLSKRDLKSWISQSEQTWFQSLEFSLEI